MFKFQLALRLGRTVAELESSMSAREFDLWQAFNLFEPIGVQREDMLAANIANTCAASNGVHGFTMADFMLYRNRAAEIIDEPVDELPTVEEEQDMMNNLYSMFGKK